MTQKQAVKNIIEAFDNRLIAKHFISNWLEDINWHTENGLLGDSFTKEDDIKIEALSELNCILNSSDYSESYIDEFKETETGKKAQEAINYAKTYKSDIFHYRGYGFSKNMLFEFRRAEAFYICLNYIFGWGIDTTDWTSGGSGKAFVDELLEMVNSLFDKKEKEAEANRKAYANMCD